MLDVSNMKSVRDFARRWGRRPLNVLINNAGIFNFGGKDHPKIQIQIHTDIINSNNFDNNTACIKQKDPQ